MIAIKDMLPTDADEQAQIERILREQPDLQVMIEKAQAKAHEMFSDPHFTLDTRQYDDWDPPIRLIIRADVAESDYSDALLGYIHWMSHEPGYDRDRIMIFPFLHAVSGTAR
jgi:hypothetical protein